jgi:hypothetical protein
MTPTNSCTITHVYMAARIRVKDPVMNMWTRTSRSDLFLKQSKAAVVLSSKWAASTHANFLQLTREPSTAVGVGAHSPTPVHKSGQHGPEPVNTIAMKWNTNCFQRREELVST